MTTDEQQVGVPTLRCCVTGAGGFIASHLVEALLRRGWQVTALAHCTGRGDWGWLETHHARPAAGLTAVRGDITDPHVVAAALAGCEVEFHLAALVAVPCSYEAPASYFRTNLDGTLNIVEAVSVGELVQTILDLVGSGATVVVDPARGRTSRSEVQRLVSDHGKARRLLGWRPLVPLREGLRATVEWMRERTELYRPGEYSTCG